MSRCDTKSCIGHLKVFGQHLWDLHSPFGPVQAFSGISQTTCQRTHQLISLLGRHESKTAPKGTLGLKYWTCVKLQLTGLK